MPQYWPFRNEGCEAQLSFNDCTYLLLQQYTDPGALKWKGTTTFKLRALVKWGRKAQACWIWNLSLPNDLHSWFSQSCPSCALFRHALLLNDYEAAVYDKWQDNFQIPHFLKTVFLCLTPLLHRVPQLLHSSEVVKWNFGGTLQSGARPSITWTYDYASVLRYDAVYTGI